METISVLGKTKGFHKATRLNGNLKVVKISNETRAKTSKPNHESRGNK